ncbi:hypothetical protein J0H58_38990 [bacterium]|nr:hypothetical protein [bacterium]
MTATTLSRHYPSLRPDERLALMLAAAARGDDLDHARLVAAAPRVTFTTLDTFPRALAFREVLDRFRAERLDLAARYFHARSLAAGATGRVRERFDGVARVYGYLLLAYRDGWARFCEQVMLPPGGLDEHLVGGEVLAAAEGEAEDDAVTGAAVEGFFRRAGESASGSLRTAASVAGELAETFAARLAWWEGTSDKGTSAGGPAVAGFRQRVDSTSSWPCQSSVG